MKESIQSIMEWHAKTFPDATLEGQVRKFMKERKEYWQSRSLDIMELADMFIVACGIARFHLLAALSAFAQVYEETHKTFNSQYITPEKLEVAIDEKMEINRKRKWNFDNGLYQHKD